MKTNTHSPDGLRPSSAVEIRIPEGDYVEIQTKWIGRHGVRIPTDRREFIGPGRLVFIPDEDDDESEPMKRRNPSEMSESKSKRGGAAEG